MLSKQPCRIACLLMAGSWLSSPALAQNTTAGSATATEQAEDADAPEPGDIVVTALRRETSLQRTPVAISAVSGDRLATLGITDTVGLARVSPGLVLRESGLSGTRITIRNIRAAGEATVGLYYDDIPIMGSAGVNSDAGGTLPAIRLFDVERVEVLRGPQGTLYGSSAMAGAVRLVFAKPDPNEYAGAFAGQMTSVAHGGLGFDTQGMVNVPLVADAVAVRIVGFVKEQPRLRRQHRAPARRPEHPAELGRTRDDADRPHERSHAGPDGDEAGSRRIAQRLFPECRCL